MTDAMIGTAIAMAPPISASTPKASSQRRARARSTWATSSTASQRCIASAGVVKPRRKPLA